MIANWKKDIVFLGAFIIFFILLWWFTCLFSNACASATPQCTPTPSLVYPIPTDSVIPDNPTDTPICLQVGDEDIQIPCISPSVTPIEIVTPTAGPSATIAPTQYSSPTPTGTSTGTTQPTTALPTSAPDTGRG